MRAPSVSVITPVFNPGVFLRPAVESVLAQSRPDFELLLVDDGSTDGSREWLRTIGDPRVRLLENPSNLGPAATRNRALAEARGEFVAFLNHDDIATPDRLARQVTHLQANPALGLLGGALQVRETATGCESLWTGPASGRGIRWHGLLDCPMRLSTVMIRREALERHRLLFDPQRLVHADYDWVMRAVRAVPAANLPETLATACRHPGSISIRRATALQAAAAQIALESIRAELPDFPLDFETMVGLRTVLAGSPGKRRTLAFTKRMLDIQFNLLAAFHAKYPDGPDVAGRPTPALSSDHA